MRKWGWNKLKWERGGEMGKLKNIYLGSFMIQLQKADNQCINNIIILYIPTFFQKFIAKMQYAIFSLISQHKSPKPINIYFNQPLVEIDHIPKKSPKYKKVGKTTKAILMEMVEGGSSIISAAGKLGINYSTAKSIIQARNRESQIKSPSQCMTDDSLEKNQGKEEVQEV